MPDPGGRSERRRTWTEVAVVLAVILPLQLYGAIYWLAYPERHDPGGVVSESLYLIANSLAWLALALYVIHRSGQPRDAFGLHRPFRLLDLVTVALLVLAVRAMEALLPQAVQVVLSADLFETTWFGGVDHTGPAEQATVLGVALVVVSSLANASAEEVMMRGYLLRRFEQLSGSPATAVAASSLVFASYHVYQGVYGLLWAFLFGAVFGSAFVVVRRVWPLVWAHFLFDAVRSQAGETSVYATGIALGLLLVGIPLLVAVRSARRRGAG